MGKRFRFRLEKVLRYRKSLEEKEKEVMMGVSMRYRKLEGEVLGLRVELEGIRESEVGVHLKGYMEGLWEGYGLRIEKKEEELRVIRKELEELKVRYMKLKKDVKVLELLKERSWKEYEKKMRDAEQYEEDEAFLVGGILGRGRRDRVGSGGIKRN